MSFATNDLVAQFNGQPGPSRREISLGPNQEIKLGTIAVLGDGSVYRASSPTVAPLSSFLLTVPGADANGGVQLYATQGNVRYIQIAGGANRALGVSVAYTTSTVDVTVQLATDAGSASTSTAQAVVNAVTGHAVSGKFIKAGYTGTGLGITAALATLTSLKQICVIGISSGTYSNLSNPVAINTRMAFYSGEARVATLASDAPTRTMRGSLVAIVDDSTVKATVGPLDLTVRIADFEEDGTPYCSF